MANPTTNLGITKPAGENVAQNITTLNTGADNFDIAGAGLLTLSVAGAADITLKNPVSVPPDTQALNIAYKFTGVLTGNISVKWPASGGCARTFLVWNATTGSFTLTAKVTGGTGVVIPQGLAQLVYQDGTNIYPLGPALSPTDTSTGWTAWTSWTPTLTNITIGNGTLVCKYTQIGKLITCRFSLVFGSTTSISGAAVFSLPVTRAAYGGTNGITPLGLARMFDTSAGATWEGNVLNLSTTTVQVNAWDASAAAVKQLNTSSTVPFTWATGDEIGAQFSYEAA